jgi:hypothetical protein
MHIGLDAGDKLVDEEIRSTQNCSADAIWPDAMQTAGAAALLTQIGRCNLVDVDEDDEGAGEFVNPDPVVPTVDAN